MNTYPGPQLQRGGTLIGLIIGLLVGLGIALVVAVYVTKVPVPLMDRNVQQPPASAAVEAERNRNWDPNAALQSRPATAPESAQPVAPAPATPTEPAPAPPSADPLGQLIEQQLRTAPDTVAAVTAAPAVDPFIYFVQAGAFQSAAEAQAQRARLGLSGLEASVSEREQAGRPVFRVRLGPFDRRVDAEIMEQRVQGLGIETALVRVRR